MQARGLPDELAGVDTRDDHLRVVARTLTDLLRADFVGRVTLDLPSRSATGAGRVWTVNRAGADWTGWSAPGERRRPPRGGRAARAHRPGGPGAGVRR
jgi:hypothetical protein